MKNVPSHKKYKSQIQSDKKRLRNKMKIAIKVNNCIGIQESRREQLTVTKAMTCGGFGNIIEASSPAQSIEDVDS